MVKKTKGQTLAEDIVRGDATPNDCIYVLRSNIADLSSKIGQLAGDGGTDQELSDDDRHLLHQYICELTSELASFGVPEGQRSHELGQDPLKRPSH